MIIAMRESTTRRRAAAWSFTGSTYLASTGASGSYAETANDLAAKVFFTAAGVLGPATFCAWIRGTLGVTSTHVVYVIGTSSTTFCRIYGADASSGTILGSSRDAAGGSLAATSIAGVGATIVDWLFVALALSTDTSNRIKIAAGATVSAEVTDATPDTHHVGSQLRLFASNTGGGLLAGDIRNAAVFGRYLSNAELTELHALGPTHDLRVSSGNYTGAGPVHWWPADGDSGTTVTDRGSVGGCNLTLNGGVTIAAV